MDTLNPRAVIGGNEPPLKERLEIDHAALLHRAAEAAALVPMTLRPIESDDEASAYTDTAADIKAVIVDADAVFKREKAPWLAGGRTVEDFFAFRKTLQAAVDRVTAALNQRQRAILEAARKAAAEEAERARKEAELFGEDAPPAAAPVMAKEAARIVSTASGVKASATMKWKGEVVDIDKVPRQYLMVNQAAVDAAIKGGVREIPGVRIFEDLQTSIRRR